MMRVTAYIPILILVASLSTPAFAQDRLAHFGNSNPTYTAVPKTFRLLNWNVHKGADHGLIQDFGLIGKDVQINLFQEAVENTEWNAGLTQAQPSLAWSLARSFISNSESDFHGYTGVATGTSIAPLSETALISTVTEPVSNTPKTVLMTEFKIEGSEETLLVVNAHLINFVMDDGYTQHLQQIIDAAQNHQGPILIAGDFNTWSDSRIYYLKLAMNKLNLERVPIDNYYYMPIIYPYDHIFIRGLKVVKAETLHQITTSDHLPLLIELEIPSSLSPLALQ